MRRAKARLLTRPDATTILIFRLYLLARNSADKSLNKFRLHRVPSVLTAVRFARRGSSPTSGFPIRSWLGWGGEGERLIVRVCQYHLLSSPVGRGWVRVRSLPGG